MKIKLLENLSPEIRVHGWIGVRVCKNRITRCFQLNSRNRQNRFMRLVQKFWQAGFRFIHLNFEPVSNHNLDFVHLLKMIKLKKPKKHYISLAGYSIATDNDIHFKLQNPKKSFQTPYFWSISYYQIILPLVDHLVVMNYDTALNTKKEYIQFTKNQTIQLIQFSNNFKKETRLGIPTYEIGRKGVFKPEIENISTALTGVQNGLASYPQARFDFGLSIFINWETTDQDWRRFGKFCSDYKD